MEVIILGTSAGGIPQSDCRRCIACRTAIEKGGKDVRTRQAILIRNGDGYSLIDTDPDLRFQLIREGISLKEIKEVFLTHTHADHTFGMYEFALGNITNVPIYSDRQVLEYLFTRSFNFICNYGCLVPTEITEEIKLRELKFKPFEVPHTPEILGPTLGFRITDGKKILTYAPDVGELTSKVVNNIDNSNVLIFDGVFYDREGTDHVPIIDSIPVFQKLNIDEIIYTQMNHTEMTHGELEERLKPYGFKVAYDGMRIKL